MRNIIKHNLKQKIWLTGIFTLLFILCRPMMQLMTYENNVRVSTSQMFLLDAMESFFLPSVFTDYVPTLISCVVIAIVFFGYLFSKKQVDLYHSIPVDRKNLFIANYLSGVFVYIFALVVEFVISILIAIPNHYMTATSFKNIVVCIICNIVHFLFGYSTAVLAVMLTGNIVVALAASAALAMVFPVISEIVEYFERYYYVTYTACSAVEPNMLTKYYWLSPVTSYATIISRCSHVWDDYFFKNAFMALPAMIIPVIVTVLIVALSYYLYMKRPSEAAGKSLAFKKTRAYFEIPIVIIAGLVGAVFMSTSINTYKTPWIWFGAVLAAVLAHFILEAIFNESFSSIISHKVQLVLSVAAVIIVIAIFNGDLMGYDKYIPDRNNIETASVYFSDIDNNLSYMKVEEDPLNPGYYTSTYYGAEEVAFRQQFTDSTLIDKVVGISQIGTSCVDDMIAEKISNSDDGIYYNAKAVSEFKYATPDITANGDDLSDMADDEAYKLAFKWMEENGVVELERKPQQRTMGVEIYYVLKSGKKVMRRYDIPLSKVIDSMNSIYSTKEFNRNHFDIYEAYENGIFNKVDVYDNYESRIISVSEEHMNELMDAYLSDLEKISIDTISQVPIGRISPSFKVSAIYDETFSGYYIYPEFSNTLAVIESYGADTSGLKSSIDANEIASISISSYNMYGYNENDTLYASDVVYDSENDAAYIKELAPMVVNATNVWSNQMLIDNKTHNGDNGIDMMAYVASGNGIQRTFSIIFKDGQVPDRIKKDIAVKIWLDNQF